VPHRADGSIDPALIAAACDVNRTNSQFALPAVVCLETPQNRCGGIPLTLEYLAEIADLAAARGIPVHLDGARIFNAALALGITADQIATFADTVQVCLSKGLSAPAGSLLAGATETIAQARRHRKPHPILVPKRPSGGRVS
jgi:threonine aldolase